MNCVPFPFFYKSSKVDVCENLLDQMFEMFVSDRYPVLDRLDSRMVYIHRHSLACACAF